MRVLAFLDSALDGAAGETTADDATAVFREHAGFVWASLQRLGVRDADLDDALQEVFVVVHRRLSTFDASAKMTTWLFGICLRVASSHRRRGYRRRETIMADVPEEAAADRAAPSTPEDELARGENRRRLEAILDELDLERRAVFVMYEIDEMSCDDIASVFGVPVGTVWSRLHAARKDFQRALGRMHAREAFRRSP